MPFSNDLKLVTSAHDGMVRLNELYPDGRSVRKVRILAKHQDACHKLTFVPDQPFVFLSAGEEGSVRLIDLRTNKSEQ